MYRAMIIRNADVVFLTQAILQPQAFHLPAFEQGNAVVPSSGYEYQSVSDQTAGRLQTMRPVWSRGVARWFRRSLSVADPFVCRCLTRPAMLPFPHPAHRTGRADF